MSVLLAGVGAAWAEDVHCEGGDSINGILETLDKEVPNGLYITGSCVEAVVVDGFKQLSLIAGEPGAAIVRPVTPSGEQDVSALQIKDSGFWIDGLTFEGPGIYDWSPPLVSVTHSSGWLVNSTIRGSRTGGLGIGDGSHAYINGATIQDNQGNGLGVGGHSTVEASMYPYPGMADLVLIAGNKVGVSAGGGAVVSLGNVEIRDSLEHGIQSSSSAEVWLGSYDEPSVIAATDVHDNGAFPYIPAVAASGGGWVYLWHVRIHHNRVAGVQASDGGVVAVCCSNEPQVEIVDNDGYGMSAQAGGNIHGWLPAIVEGNSRGGVAIQQGSQADFGAVVEVRGNGDPTDPDSFGGFFVDNSSALSLANITIVENYGPGVFIRGNSSIVFGENVAITGNEGYGVLLELSSTAAFGDTVSATGNRKFDLVCASGSVAGAPKGSHSTIGKMQCTQWYQLQRLPD